MRIEYLVLTCLICLTSCREDYSRLHKLPIESVLHLYEVDSLPDLTAINVVRLSDNKRIPRSSIKSINYDSLAFDYYSNSTGVIRKAVLRPRTFEDQILAILIKNKDYNPQEGTFYIPFDCSEIVTNMEEVYRMSSDDYGIDSDEIYFFDFERAKITSIIKQCGFPELSTFGKEGLRIFWLMVQHNEPEVISHYYLNFKRLVDIGELESSIFALMTDRLLMNHGYKQIYGSQILNSKLYPIESPHNVDDRRKSVGLGPLKDYLSEYFGIEYEPPNLNLN